jgi:hypothetical protein
MSVDPKEPIVDEKAKLEAEQKKKEFLEIRDYKGDLIYTCSEEEFEQIITDTLMLGRFTKTFSLLNGKIELTYETIFDKDRADGYKYIREYTTINKDKLSNVELESFTSKVNIILQLARIKNNGNTINLAQGALDERMALLGEAPELQVSLYSKWLSVFANITNKAFNYEDTLKN